MSEKILIIDDSPMERQYMRRLLEKAGVEAFESPDYDRVSDDILDEKYGMVFLDYYIPGVDTFKAISDIRKEIKENNKSINLVVLGDESELSDIISLSDGKISGLDKPVRFDELKNIIEKPVFPFRDSVVPSAKEDVNEKADSVPADTEEKSLSFIDEELGIKNCGSVDGYEAAKEIYIATGEDKLEEIRGYFSAEDWKNYTIKVHALKSSSRIVGASELGNLAEELEKAGNDENIDLIREKTDMLLQGYRDCLNALKTDDDGEDEDLPEVDPAHLKDAYESLKEFAGQEDYDLIEMVLDDIKGYKLPKEDKEKMKEIRSKLMQWDWKGIEEMLS